MIDLNEERRKILSEAYEHRQREVIHHQINIDNYRLAISEIKENYTDSKELAEFADRMRDLLESSIIEQQKEIILRDVIAKQLKG